MPEFKHAEIAQKVKRYYFGDKSIDKAGLIKLADMVGDRIFGTDAVKAAKMQAKVNHSLVWFYSFKHRPSTSASELLSGSKENFGNIFNIFKK